MSIEIGTQEAPQLLHFAKGTEVSEGQRKQSIVGGSAQELLS